MKRTLIPFLLSVLVVAWLAPPAGAAVQRPFEVGFADGLFGGPTADRWAGRAASVGAGSIRVNVYWSLVATRQPKDPRDPDDPAYDFAAIDNAVRAADANGLSVLMTVLNAPFWAEGPDRPDFEQAPPGTWRPDPEAFGDFAHALAERYSGSHPDPDAGRALPEVDLYSAWNEPNITTYISPQYVDGQNESAAIYVGLLNAFYDAVKEVNPEAVVATGGTAPIGDPSGAGKRTAPLEFWRDVLCLSPNLERAASCASDEAPRFDLLAHHPINYLLPPRAHGDRPDDILVADFGKLTAALRAAEALGTVAPTGPHGLIAPELWWETDPPDRKGISLARQARYMELGLYLLWKQGAEGAWFLQVRDARRRQGEPGLSSYQTGIYRYSGRRKPSYRAIRFPFVVDRAVRGRRALAWGRAPRGGRVRIEVKHQGGQRWRRKATLRVRPGEVFARQLRLRKNQRARARVGRETSLIWRPGG